MERLTEQKLKNKKFRNNETSIRNAFFLVKETFCVTRFIKTAGISRSTLYRHHQNIHGIVPDYEKYVLRRCKNTFQRLMKHKYTQTKTLYEHLLTFMVANQEIMQFLFDYGTPDFTEKLILALEPKIITTGKVKSGEMYAIYAKEIAAVIENWERDGFKKEGITTTVNKIIYLTDTARARLGPLSSFDHPSRSSSSSSKD